MSYNQWVILIQIDPDDDQNLDFYWEDQPERKVKFFSSSSEAIAFAENNLGLSKTAIAPLVDPSNLADAYVTRTPKP